LYTYRWGRSQILVLALGCLAAGFGVLVSPPTPAHLPVVAALLAASSSRTELTASQYTFDASRTP
jgi:hypothetical protein